MRPLLCVCVGECVCVDVYEWVYVVSLCVFRLVCECVCVCVNLGVCVHDVYVYVFMRVCIIPVLAFKYYAALSSQPIQVLFVQNQSIILPLLRHRFCTHPRILCVHKK